VPGHLRSRSHFSNGRKQIKTHHSPVTPFDRWILTGVDGDRSDKAIINKIKSDLGITVTKHVVDYYRALLMGRIIAKPQEMDQVVAK